MHGTASMRMRQIGFKQLQQGSISVNTSVKTCQTEAAHGLAMCYFCCNAPVHSKRQ
jgi:hypothetical protein